MVKMRRAKVKMFGINRCIIDSLLCQRYSSRLNLLDNQIVVFCVNYSGIDELAGPGGAILYKAEAVNIGRLAVEAALCGTVGIDRIDQTRKFAAEAFFVVGKGNLLLGEQQLFEALSFYTVGPQARHLGCGRARFGIEFETA